MSVQNVSALETDGTLTFDVRLSATSGQVVRFNRAVTAGTAESGDFVAIADSQVSINIGSQSLMIPVTISNDNDTDDDTITLTLTHPENATFDPAGTELTATGTITEALGGPTISITSSAERTGVTEGHEFTFNLASDRDLGGTPLDVEFSVTDGGTGATITGTTVQIPGNAQTATGTVTGIGDVSSATNIVIAIKDTTRYDVSTVDPSITVNVKDNDITSPTNPRISIAPASNNPARVDLSETAKFVISATDQTTAKSVTISVSGTGNFITPIAETICSVIRFGGDYTLFCSNY